MTNSSFKNSKSLSHSDCEDDSEEESQNVIPLSTLLTYRFWASQAHEDSEESDEDEDMPQRTSQILPGTATLKVEKEESHLPSSSAAFTWSPMVIVEPKKDANPELDVLAKELDNKAENEAIEVANKSPLESSAISDFVEVSSAEIDAMVDDIEAGIEHCCSTAIRVAIESDAESVIDCMELFGVDEEELEAFDQLSLEKKRILKFNKVITEPAISVASDAFLEFTKSRRDSTDSYSSVNSIFSQNRVDSFEQYSFDSVSGFLTGTRVHSSSSLIDLGTVCCILITNDIRNVEQISEYETEDVQFTIQIADSDWRGKIKDIIHGFKVQQSQRLFTNLAFTIKSEKQMCQFQLALEELETHRDSIANKDFIIEASIAYIDLYVETHQIKPDRIQDLGEDVRSSFMFRLKSTRKR